MRKLRGDSKPTIDLQQFKEERERKRREEIKSIRLNGTLTNCLKVEEEDLGREV